METITEKEIDRKTQIKNIIDHINLDEDPERKPSQECFIISNWLLKNWDYPVVMEGLRNLDCTPLKMGDGYRGMYAFLRPRMESARIIYYEKKAETEKEELSESLKMLGASEERIPVQNDDSFNRSKSRLQTLIKLRPFSTPEQRRDIDQEIRVITNKLGIEI